jgi:hypothetical protein
MNKYTVRKLVFIGILLALIAAPFGVNIWYQINNPDPFVHMARYIESFEKGGVDVLTIFEIGGSDRALAVLVYIKDYPDKWTSVDRENFNRWNLNMLRDNGYKGLELAIGWDYPPPNMRMQGVIVCTEPAAASCLPMQNVNIIVRPEFQRWEGIGKP